MKTIGKTIRESRGKVHDRMAAWLRPKLGALGMRWRLPARIRLANARAARHPRRTFACVAGFLLLLLLGTAVTDTLRTESSFPDVSGIAGVDPLLDGFRSIQANKDIQRQTLQELAATGNAIRQELDSLITVTHKTRADSLRIVDGYRRLENIVKSLKNNDTND